MRCAKCLAYCLAQMNHSKKWLLKQDARPVRTSPSLRITSFPSGINSGLETHRYDRTFLSQQTQLQINQFHDTVRDHSHLNLLSIWSWLFFFFLWTCLSGDTLPINSAQGNTARLPLALWCPKKANSAFSTHILYWLDLVVLRGQSKVSGFTFLSKEK